MCAWLVGGFLIGFGIRPLGTPNQAQAAALQTCTTRSEFAGVFRLILMSFLPKSILISPESLWELPSVGR